MQLASLAKTISFVPGVFSYILFLYPALLHNLILHPHCHAFLLYLQKNHPTKTPLPKTSFLPQDAFERASLLSGSLLFLLSVLGYILALTVLESVFHTFPHFFKSLKYKVSYPRAAREMSNRSIAFLCPAWPILRQRS